MRAAFASSTRATQASASAGVLPNSTCRATSRRAADVVVGLEVDDLVELGAHGPPLGPVEQQVVALRHDEPGLGRHGERAGDRLLEVALEAGRVHDVVALLAQPPQQGGVPPGVEGVRRALAVEPAERGRA